MEAFQVKRRIRQAAEKRKRRIERRLEKARKLEDSGRPVMRRGKACHEVALRATAMPHGGIGAALETAVSSGLVDGINSRLELLKIHRPYHESDHVLSIAFNALCGGHCLDDIELRRNDEAYLDALGAPAIPDPTTAGDFCRRFDADDVEVLMDVINDARVEVWKRQGAEFKAQTARIDADGTHVGTTGECKEGMALSHKGIWGYHPLLISLANTNEPLFIANRSGNRPSHEGAVEYLDRAVALCRRAGFEDILLRGDTDFSLTRHFDSWDKDGVRFIFGYDANPSLVDRAGGLSKRKYQELLRQAEQALNAGQERAKQPRVKARIVKEKRYKKIRLRSEEVAEFEHKPVRSKNSYRMIVLRKNLSVERGEDLLLDEIRYFFYITNDRSLPPEQVVFEANARCNQENLIEQLKNGVRALHAPVTTLEANWAYMVMCSLAWTLKAWMALLLPVSPRWEAKHRKEKEAWLRMDFRTFCNAVINLPAQVIKTGRRLVIRFLCWRHQQIPLLRLLDAL